MDNKEFTKWNRKQKLKSKLRKKNNTEMVNKLLRRKEKGMWNIPDNF